MKRILFMAVGLVLALAGSVQAQTKIDCIDGTTRTLPDRCPAWTFGVDLGFGKPTGIEPVIGSVSKSNDSASTVGGNTSVAFGANRDQLVVPQKRSIPFNFSLFGGYMPEDWWGAAVRFSRFGSNGELGPTTQPNLSGNTLAEVRMWPDQDVKPLVFTTGLAAFSPTTYMAEGDWAITRFEAVATRGAWPPGVQLWVFGGVSFLKVENSRAEAQQRKVLLTPVNPVTKQPLTTSTLKDFDFQTRGAANYSGFGPILGLELETCPLWGGLFVQARAAFSYVVGNAIESGHASQLERIMLTQTSAGLSGSGQVLATVSFDGPLSETKRRANVSIVDLQASLGWRFGPVHLRGGISASRLIDVPVAPSWAISPAQSFQFGQWKQNSSTIGFLNPTVTAVLRF